MDNVFGKRHGLIPPHVAFVSLPVEEKVSLWAASWANDGGLRYALRNPYASLTHSLRKWRATCSGFWPLTGFDHIWLERTRLSFRTFWLKKGHVEKWYVFSLSHVAIFVLDHLNAIHSVMWGDRGLTWTHQYINTFFPPLKILYGTALHDNE